MITKKEIHSGKFRFHVNGCVQSEAAIGAGVGIGANILGTLWTRLFYLSQVGVKINITWRHCEILGSKQHALTRRAAYSTEGFLCGWGRELKSSAKLILLSVSEAGWQFKRAHSVILFNCSCGDRIWIYTFPKFICEKVKAIWISNLTTIATNLCT